MKKFSPSSKAAFTLVELLTVMLIILILAGLILASVGFAQKKAARNRAEGEILALSTAIESYKTDNGIYPRGSSNGVVATDSNDADTDKLNPNYSQGPTASGDPTSAVYKTSSLALYVLLSGDTTKSGVVATDRTNYLSKGFKDDLYGRTSPSLPIKAVTNPVLYLSDPFGNSYGYSTANSHYFTDPKTANVSPPKAPGYNPTFDLWCTGGDVTSAVSATTQAKWVKNW